jgi:hypothetical protein
LCGTIAMGLEFYFLYDHLMIYCKISKAVYFLLFAKKMAHQKQLQMNKLQLKLILTPFWYSMKSPRELVHVRSNSFFPYEYLLIKQLIWFINEDTWDWWYNSTLHNSGRKERTA